MNKPNCRRATDFEWSFRTEVLIPLISILRAPLVVARTEATARAKVRFGGFTPAAFAICQWHGSRRRAASRSFASTITLALRVVPAWSWKPGVAGSFASQNSFQYGFRRH